MLRFFQSDTDKYWYDLQTLEIEGRGGNFHDLSQRSKWSKEKSKPKMLAGSDNLPGGVNGIINHADGKRYDSKSAYEKAVKAKGCQIVGNDWNGSKWKAPLERGVRGDFNVRPQLKDSVSKVLGG